MELRPLAHAPFAVSAVGLGCNNFGRVGTASETQEGTNAVIHAALDAGVTFFDTADIYGGQWGLSESLMREALVRAEKLWPGKALRIGAQRYLERFYGEFGFGTVSAPYDEDGIPHVEMLRPASSEVDAPA